MFRLSKDDFIASKQREQADTLYQNILKKSSLIYSSQIESLFDKHVKSFSFVEELVKISGNDGHPITIPFVPWDSSEYQALRDLKIAYTKANRSWDDSIPFIEFSFPEEYDNPHGHYYTHNFVGFFTPFSNLDGAEECVIYYLKKLIKLKAFA